VNFLENAADLKASLKRIHESLREEEQYRLMNMPLQKMPIDTPEQRAMFEQRFRQIRAHIIEENNRKMQEKRKEYDSHFPEPTIGERMFPRSGHVLSDLKIDQKESDDVLMQRAIEKDAKDNMAIYGPLKRNARYL
jgi:hypothetical protein